MSNMKHDAIVSSGIEIGERVPIPKELVPRDAQVEIDAKMAAGYYASDLLPDAVELAKPKGRSY
jgi:GTP cyclohydrolase II